MDLRYISASIPVVPQHLGLFESLLANLEAIQPEFDELVFVFSGLNKAETDRALSLLSSLRLNSRAIHVPLLPLGVNRNLGWLETTGDVVCFLDADDLYSSDYRKVVQSRFEEFSPDVLLHSHIPFSTRKKTGDASRLFESKSNESFAWVESQELKEANELGLKRQRDIELRVEASASSLSLPDRWNWPVHQGHASVLRSIISSVNYINERGMRNEDGIFAKDCLEAGLSVLVTNDRITAYSLNTSAIPWNFKRVARIITRLMNG